MIIYRGRTKDVVFEFLPPRKKILGYVILCDGIPSVPKQKEVLSMLADYGYFAIYPRYRGTWESGGEFLKKSPTKDIEQIIKLIKTKEISELYNNKIFKIQDKPIHLIGSSFGASVALGLAEQRDINKIIALSPITNFENHDNDKEQDLIHLGQFLSKAFCGAYRFKADNYKKLLKGDLFEPPKRIKDNRRKHILIAFDTQDHEIESSKIAEYASKNSLAVLKSTGLGHLSFSKLPTSQWYSMIRWLKK